MQLNIIHAITKSKKNPVQFKWIWSELVFLRMSYANRSLKKLLKEILRCKISHWRLKHFGLYGSWCRKRYGNSDPLDESNIFDIITRSSDPIYNFWRNSLKQRSNVHSQHSFRTYMMGKTVQDYCEQLKCHGLSVILT